MEIITSSLDYRQENSLDKNICFFDIETTGLSRDRDIIYLIGILYFDNNSNCWTLRQYFANDLKDETQLLIEAVDFLSSFDTIVNYNGNSFDIPFLNYRLKLFDIDMALSKDKSLDLYAILRKNRDFISLKNLKLTSVERFLGIHREDIYSGKDCIQFYKDYILKGDLDLKERVLKHNYDDLYYLLQVLKILDILEENKTIRFEKDGLDLSFIIRDMYLEKDFFTVSMEIAGNLNYNIYFYGNNYKLFINDSQMLEFTFEVKKGLISPEEEALFIINREFGLDNLVTNSYSYNLPKEISIITIKNRFMVENIKKIISALLSKLI